jgi:hypothetical protein
MLHSSQEARVSIGSSGPSPLIAGGNSLFRLKRITSWLFNGDLMGFYYLMGFHADFSWDLDKDLPSGDD